MFLDFRQSGMQFPLLELFNEEMWFLDIVSENPLLHFQGLHFGKMGPEKHML